MHFFYLDESGDTGKDLQNVDQPVFVLAGIKVRDQSWNKTRETLDKIFSDYFSGSIPDGFEFHSKDALSPSGLGHFDGHSIEDRTALAKKLLSLIAEHKHGTFYTAIDKKRLGISSLGKAIEYNPKRPYPLAFDTLLTSINSYVKKSLGSSARGMVLFDEKKNHHNELRALMKARRFTIAKTHRIKWIVEFGTPLDSVTNPMIQLADLVAYTCRRFLELEHGYRPNWNSKTKTFCAECYSIIDSRLLWKTISHREESNRKELIPFIDNVVLRPLNQWRQRYSLS